MDDARKGDMVRRSHGLFFFLMIAAAARGATPFVRPRIAVHAAKDSRQAVACPAYLYTIW